MLKGKIKLIIFDLSNVCFSMEEPPFIHDFCIKHKIDEKKFDNEYQELLKRAEIGEMTGKKVWETILSRYKIKENPDILIKEMIEQKFEHKDVLRIAKNLKDDGFPVVYLTNYNEDYWKLIASKWDMDMYFSSGIVSYQIGTRKPALEGFKKLMGIYKVEPEETLFIDDSEENLNEANKYGIYGYLFENSIELYKFLTKEKLL